MVKFKKVDLDLVLDKRDEMIRMAGNSGIDIDVIFTNHYCCMNKEEFETIMDMLGIENAIVTDFHSDEFSLKTYFMYRDMQFYLLIRKGGKRASLQE